MKHWLIGTLWEFEGVGFQRQNWNQLDARIANRLKESLRFECRTLAFVYIFILFHFRTFFQMLSKPECFQMRARTDSNPPVALEVRVLAYHRRCVSHIDERCSFAKKFLNRLRL